ncbi:MAG: baseplate J/gp47 family protein, partial [Janthinobacterium lividum]
MSGTYTTAVPTATVGATGFLAPPEVAILAGVQADQVAAFGSGINPALSTPQGQLATSTTAILGDCYDTFMLLANALDPAYAAGRFQDAIARIYFIERNPAQSTVAQVSCLGGNGVVIPVGALAQDTASGTVYACTEAGTIPAGGTVVLPFAAVTTGPLPVPVAMTVYQSIAGWDAVTPVSGVLGNVVESRADFEFRRQQSVAKNAVGTLPAIRGAVLGVSGVLDVYTTENDTNAYVSTGGISLNPNGLYIAVVGGDPDAVAQAIWSKKMPGCPYYSLANTTVSVSDYLNYSAPYPSYPVSWHTPTATPIYFAVTIANTPAVPSDALIQIQGAIMQAF